MPIFDVIASAIHSAFLAINWLIAIPIISTLITLALLLRLFFETRDIRQRQSTSESALVRGLGDVAQSLMDIRGKSDLTNKRIGDLNAQQQETEEYLLDSLAGTREQLSHFSTQIDTALQTETASLRTSLEFQTQQLGERIDGRTEGLRGSVRHYAGALKTSIEASSTELEARLAQSAEQVEGVVVQQTRQLIEKSDTAHSDLRERIDTSSGAIQSALEAGFDTQFGKIDGLVSTQTTELLGNAQSLAEQYHAKLAEQVSGAQASLIETMEAAQAAQLDRANELQSDLAQRAAEIQDTAEESRRLIRDDLSKQVSELTKAQTAHRKALESSIGSAKKQTKDLLDKTLKSADKIQSSLKDIERIEQALLAEQETSRALKQEGQDLEAARTELESELGDLRDEFSALSVELREERRRSSILWSGRYDDKKALSESKADKSALEDRLSQFEKRADLISRIAVEDGSGDSLKAELARIFLLPTDKRVSPLKDLANTHPDNAHVAYLLASTRLEQGATEPGLGYMTVAVKLGIKQGEKWSVVLGWAMEALDHAENMAETDQAAELISRIAQHPKATEHTRAAATVRLSILFESRGETDRAEKALADLLEAYPDNKKLRTARAKFRVRCGRFKKALEDLDLLETDGTHLAKVKAAALVGVGRIEDAAASAASVPNPNDETAAIAETPALLLTVKNLKRGKRGKLKDPQDQLVVAEALRRAGDFRAATKAYGDLHALVDSPYSELGLVRDNRAVPALILGGPPRSGTTLLRRSAGLNKAINMRPGEPEFISTTPRAKLETYLEPFQLLLDASEDEGVEASAEKSPQLIAMDADRIALMSAMFPEARFVFTLRDPVARAWSFLKHMNRTGQHEVLFSHPVETLPRWARRTLEEGEYEQRLSTWAKAVDPKRIFLCDFDALASDPPKALGEICDWAGISSQFDPLDIRNLAGSWDNRTPSVEMPDELKTKLTEHYASETTDVKALCKALGTAGLWSK